jgi:ABC-type transporter Mla MlaB component
VDHIFLKHVIDHSHDAGGRLVLSGDLTEATVAKLVEKLDTVGVRPKVADVGAIRFGDAAGLLALARWVRRSGRGALQLLNPPHPLQPMIERWGLETALPTVASGSRRAMAA